jgi:hypothetical protein
MDPVSIALLASGALSAGAGVAGSLLNNKQQRYNREQLDALMRRKESGTLGMSGTQQRLLDQQLNAPVASAASQAQQRAEQIAAATGGTSGADLSRLRTERDRTVASGAQNAALQIAAANEQERMRQLNEIEQRLAAQSAMRRDDFNQIAGGFSQAMGPIGELAGGPPATLRMSNLFGGRFSREETETLLQFAEQDPDGFSRMFRNAMGSAGSSGAVAAGSAIAGG